MKILLAGWLVLLASCGTSHRSTNENAVIALPRTDDAVIAEKIFSNFITVNDSLAFRKELYSSSAAKQLAAGIFKQYQSALKNCNSANCLFRNLIVNREDSATMVLLMNKLQPRDSTATTQGRSTTGESIAAFNYILRTYLGGQSPRYPKIDAMSFASADPAYADSVKKSLADFLSRPASKISFFSLPMLTALRLLELNGRNEAARYYPLTGGLNQPAYNMVKNISWTNYSFSVILVPGLGPQSPAIALDAGGARRCDLAVEQYRLGLAPYIMVSGGHVHPAKTKYSEAVEMQKYLVTKHKIPPEAIIIEPHARHTTTNLRNASRLVYLFGIPENKPILVVTDVFQATYIPMMTGRFMAELGYLPYRQLVRNKQGQTTFLPDRSSLRQNPYDPLDP